MGITLQEVVIGEVITMRWQYVPNAWKHISCNFASYRNKENYIYFPREIMDFDLVAGKKNTSKYLKCNKCYHLKEYASYTLQGVTSEEFGNNLYNCKIEQITGFIILPLYLHCILNKLLRFYMIHFF